MKIYLSSTFRDLEHHRARVAKALRKAQYEVVMMEEYVARDELVEFACQGDVAGCDVYVGLFAWRYGYVPEDNNPERLSVTEMELNAAEQHSIPRLVFLLEADADWPAEWCDVDCAPIDALRSRWSKRASGRFAEAGDLAVEVLASVHVQEVKRPLQRLDELQVVLKAQAIGSSYMGNIQQKLQALKHAAYVEIQIGPVPWWNTRLHLISALAEDYGTTKGFVFVDADRRFVAMAAPGIIRKQLELRWPKLGTIYGSLRLKTSTLALLETQLWLYPTVCFECLGVEEEDGIEVITRRHLEYDLILPRDGEVVEAVGKKPLFLMREIVGRRSPYVVLERDGQVEGLVDRGALTTKVAAEMLANLAQQF